MGEETPSGSGPGEDRRSFDPSYCPSCGYELLPPGEFCSHCGTEIPDTENATGKSTSEASATGSSTDEPSTPEQSTSEAPDDDGDARSRSRGSASTPGDERSGRTADESPADGHRESGDEPSATGDGESRDAFRRRVSGWIDRGWSIERDYGDSVVLIKRDLGNAWVHLGLLLTTVWFTTGAVNLGYALWKYFGKPDRVTLHRNAGTATVDDGETRASADRTRDSSADRSRAEEGPTASADLTPPAEPGRPGVEPTVEPAATGDEPDPERSLESLDRAVGITFVLIAAGIVALAGITPASVLVASLVLLAAGICFPSIRRNFRPTHPIGTFGPTKSTEERSVQDAGRPCTVCGSAVEHGVERTYREEVVAAGVGLYTTEEGRNYYCEDCTVVGPSGDDPAPEPDEEASIETEESDRDAEPSVESASE